ncbi:MAG: sigma 54 modulation/S30EA ribosomal C-terminal domain-containing protein [Verrucomicrobia bacterium]|nr:sigma 54 modulation/S30EA ribosomal C-terminal domain-containing protein [Verrucomicrobiota bacterium]MBV9658278.1 sigma 54 modulation/S30EA ribosomal C-terminal domain-containing protein [Verrucomicrobiota bacterium]
MRKHKTRLLRSHRPRSNDNVRYLREQVFSADAALNMPDTEFAALLDGSHPTAGAQHGSSGVAGGGDNGQHDSGAAVAQKQPPAQAAARPSAVVQTEKHPLKPMFVDEAILQMEMATREFLVFLNASSEKVNVLYRRPDGDFGLIQPEFA